MKHSKDSQCNFEYSEYGFCRNPKTSDSNYCSSHKDHPCDDCGAQATRTCGFFGSRNSGCDVALCKRCRHNHYA